MTDDMRSGFEGNTEDTKNDELCCGNIEADEKNIEDDSIKSDDITSKETDDDVVTSDAAASEDAESDVAITKQTLSESTQPESAYAFRWDYSEQYINDKNRESQKRSKREKGILTYAIIMTVAFLIAFSILAVALSFDNMANWFKADESNYSISDVVEIGMPSSVAVFGVHSDNTGSAGSGFILTDQGYILTNYHVVENAVNIVVVDSNDKDYSATLVGYDADIDIALLYIENSELTPVTIGDSDAVKLGEEVVAIGCPNGENFMFSVSNGIISGLNRNMENSIGMIQTNAPLNPGNSGGPLFDSKGNLIGIVTSKLVSTEDSDGKVINLEGMAFAIPINAVLDLTREWIEADLETPMLGVTAVSVQKGKSYYFNHEEGRIYLLVSEGEKLFYYNDYNELVPFEDSLLKDKNNYIFYADATGVAITEEV